MINAEKMLDLILLEKAALQRWLQELETRASPNVRHREKYGEVECFIAAWNWIEEDSVLAEAPIEWVDRYDRKLWSRADT